MKTIRDGHIRTVLAIVGVCVVIVGAWNLLEQKTMANPQGETGTLEKMIVASGNVSIDLDLNKLNGINSGARNKTLSFAAVPDSFFSVLIFNHEFRGPVPSSMELVPQNSVALPAKLNAAYKNLVVESLPWGGDYELAIRDGKSGFTFFNIEGHTFDFDVNERLFTLKDGRVLVSSEFAGAMGRPTLAGTVVGNLSISTTMRPVEVSEVVNGEVKADVLPGRTDAGSVPGPDVVVGDLSGLAQFGSSSGTRVGLAVATDSCNFGVENLHWFALPDNDHPVIPQNLYRMSGGANNDERFEQIGQSNVKHAFTALMNDICNLGCNGVSNTNLGSGCSDPYSASLNSGPNLGSRAWINPFTGAYPRGDSANNPNNHTGHTHTGPSHRILVEMNDLNTTLNAGASYFAEAQYITPHEFAWCQTHPGECNMYNNVSYRKYTVSGTTSPFSFSAAAATVRTKPAIAAWPGATLVEIKPDAANDGIAIVGYKVTNPSPGVWHYEYAVYNQNLDRAIQSFSLNLGIRASISNIGSHAPPQQPGWAADGTVGNAGFSSTPWTQTFDQGVLNWSSETFAFNPNAGAIRWGTLYNFRFDSPRPPARTLATIGFFKTGQPVTIQVYGPSCAGALSRC